jgi:hypothetical protein
MVRRRARDAGVEAAIGNHSFRDIGLTDYLENDGDITIAQRMAGHANIKTTQIYDRRGDEASFSENGSGFEVKREAATHVRASKTIRAEDLATRPAPKLSEATGLDSLQAVA